MSTIGFHGLVRGVVCDFHIDGAPQLLRVLVPAWVTTGLTVWVKKDKVRVSGDGGDLKTSLVHTLSRVEAHQVKSYVVSDVRADVLCVTTPVKDVPALPVRVSSTSPLFPPPAPPSVVVNGVTLTEEQVDTVVRALQLLNEDTRTTFMTLTERGQREALGHTRRSTEVLRLITEVRE